MLGQFPTQITPPHRLLNHPPHGTHEEAAEEFALAGKSGWPEYIVSTDEDYDVDSIKEVARAQPEKR